jgi:hypothetical protein
MTKVGHSHSRPLAASVGNGSCGVESQPQIRGQRDLDIYRDAGLEWNRIAVDNIAGGGVRDVRHAAKRESRTNSPASSEA